MCGCVGTRPGHVVCEAVNDRERYATMHVEIVDTIRGHLLGWETAVHEWCFSNGCVDIVFIA